ncbi:MAG: hypothetical protein V4556_12650 [Bacteroidota bacterium]
MKPFFLFSLLILTLTVNAQLSEKQLKEMHDNTAKIESTTVKINESMNESIRVMDSINMENFNRQNERNLNAFMAERKEQERKAQKGMYLRIGFGVLMLIVLIIGITRKRKPVENPKSS